MFKKVCAFLILVVIGLSGANTSLAEGCKVDGYTVVFVNGIFTSEEEANEGRLIHEHGCSNGERTFEVIG